MAQVYDRISARRGNPVNLDTSFYMGGVPTDPFAIYRIEIYQKAISDPNIIDAVDIVGPDESGYPSPLVRPEAEQNGGPGCIPSPFYPCDDIDTDVDQEAGRYRLIWDVPDNVDVPNTYFDVWYYFATDPRDGTESLEDHIDKLLKVCNTFWIYPDQWYADGGLNTIRFGFEAIDSRFMKPEVRPLEVGVMPLPLYDYNYNLVMPLIPYLNPTISIWSEHGEPVVRDAKCKMKIRQGAFRSNPWVISFDIDTCRFMIGTYRYRVKVRLPDGSTRVSGDLWFMIQ